MPKNSKQKTKATPKRERPTQSASTTYETDSYLEGVYSALHENFQTYHGLIKQELMLQARLELAEKTVCLHRDHLVLSVAQAECATAPSKWQPLLNMIRFVGVRLVDACMTILQEKKKLTPEQLLVELNNGMYRFRTSAPLREIHAALMRESRVKKTDDCYVWVGGGEQISLRLRPAPVHPLPAVGTEEATQKMIDAAIKEDDIAEIA
jgi:hypothetical protein